MLKKLRALVFGGRLENAGGAGALARFVQTLLFGVSALDPLMRSVPAV